MSRGLIERVALDAIEFIEDLTDDPLLDSEDVEMGLEDVQAHAGIEAASLRKRLRAALEAEASERERATETDRILASVRAYLEGQSPSTTSGGIRNRDLRALIPEAPVRKAELAAASKAIYETKGLHLSTGRQWDSATAADRYYCQQYATAALSAIGRAPPQDNREG